MSKDPLFSIPIHDLDVMGKPFAFPLPAAWVRGILEGSEVQPAGPDGQVTVDVSKMGTDVLVRGNVALARVVPCARCLEPVSLPEAAELSLLLVPSKELAGTDSRRGKRAPPEAEELEFTSEEADIDTYDGDHVVLDPFVREVILLETPLFPLCSEDCEGIRPAREAELVAVAVDTIDPRLLPLLEMSRKRTIKE